MTNISKKYFDLIKSKKLTHDDFIFSPDHDMTIKLSDQVILYNTGDQWKIVPLLISLAYPIIYDKYDTGENVYDITIAVCPVSLMATILKGVFNVEIYYENVLVLREESTNDLIPIDSGYKINEKYVVENNKRLEIKIMTLRSAIIMIPDAKYMILNSTKFKHLKSIIDIEYYSSNVDYNGNDLNSLIHPKTLVYIIQYKSYNDDENKTSILLGKDVNKSTVTGYDFRLSKTLDYLKKNNSKILNRAGYILPCLWYIAKITYPDAKLVYIG